MSQTTKEEQTEQRQDWLRRQRQRRSAGDTIAAQVGEGSNSVAVGKNIVQIGRIVVPLWALALASLCLLIIAGWLVAPAVVRLVVLPSMPDGTFNLAVAEFTLGGPTNTRTGDQTARTLARSMAAFIELQTGELAETVDKAVTVWGDQERVAPVAADEILEQRLHSLNAEVLVYGSLQAQGEDTWLITPAFFLMDEAVHQADELVGEHVLGTPIEFDPGNRASEGNLNREMRARIRALLQILMGLWEYEAATYPAAAFRFEQAAQDPEWGAAPERKGQEVLYLFLGNAYLKSASLTDAPAQIADYLGRSEAGFAKAIDYNSTYARAYNGLGSLHFLKAQLGSIGDEGCHDDWDWDELGGARASYTTALGLPAEAKPRAGSVDLYAHLGLGRIDFFDGLCLSDQISPSAWQSARSHHQFVLDSYAADPAPRLRLAVSTAHLDLADMASYETYWRRDLDPADPQLAELVESATHHYQRALDILEPLGSDEYLRQAITIEKTLIWTLCLDGKRDDAMHHLEEFVAQPAVAQATASSVTEELLQECEP